MQRHSVTHRVAYLTDFYKCCTERSVQPSTLRDMIRRHSSGSASRQALSLFNAALQLLSVCDAGGKSLAARRRGLS